MADSTVYPEPADHPEAKQFISTLAENPDPLHRLMFSDWLEDNGYANAAAGQRWASKHNKAPLGGAGSTNPTNNDWGGWTTPNPGRPARGWRNGLTRAVPPQSHTANPWMLPAAFSELPDKENETTSDRALIGQLANRGIFRHPVLASHTIDGFTNESNFLNATNMIQHWDDEGEPLTEQQHTTILNNKKLEEERAKRAEAKAKRERIRTNDANQPRLF